MQIVSERDLYKACLVLFGQDVDVTREFLYYIQPSGVKSAYRKLAMQTHPDTAHQYETETEGGPERFIETNWAYERLIEFLRHRDGGGVYIKPMSPHRAYARVRPVQRPAPRPHRPHQRKTTGNQENYYRGGIPARRLLFGQYLFYSGAISWEAVIKAIVWQRRQRPRLGDLARERNLMSEEDIRIVVSRRRPGEPIGEAAVRLMYIRRHQLSALLYKQRALQRKFGEFFVSHGILTQAALDAHYRHFTTHNFRHRSYG